MTASKKKSRTLTLMNTSCFFKYRENVHQLMSRGGAQRERERERIPRTDSVEVDMGLAPINCEIMT